MKPKYKERLVRCRPEMVRSADITKVLETMRQDDLFTQKEEDDILTDTRRRERVIRFLDILEQKKSEVYPKFLDILSDHYPHLYLMLDEFEEAGNDPLACQAQLDDDWSMLQKARQYLIQEIDAESLIPYLRKHDVLKEVEETMIMSQKDSTKRTEALLDTLEVYPPSAYDHFVDAIGEMYPHVYLVLTNDEDPDDFDDDDY